VATTNVLVMGALASLVAGLMVRLVVTTLLDIALG
jgi:hypothetical protein